MLRDASRGDRASRPPATAPDRPELCADFPQFLERAQQLLRLAELASRGPDPEALLPDVTELGRACAAFVRAHS
jgi:hypothetical protein